MKDRAYAKINLALDVKSRREDGYHELEMVMVPVSLYDELEITVYYRDVYTCNRQYITFNQKNTIVKAIDYMRKKYQIKDKFKVHLNKNIPTRAGLAGGSSDGASVIRLLDKMYQLNMTYEEKRAASLAIGADVFFCLINKPAIVKGIGDLIEPLSFNSFFHVLLVKPKQGVSTKMAFEKLDLKKADHPDISALKEALIAGDYAESIKNMQNSLEESSFRLCPEILKLKGELEAFGFDHVLMSGSGSTLFALSRDLRLVNDIQTLMRNRHYFARRVKILS